MSEPGLVSIEYRQHERTDELNERIHQRIHVDSPLQPLYHPRPAMTKYSLFPTIDQRTSSQIPLHTYLDYSTTTSFAPIQSNGPVDGYIQNVSVECDLRNQYYALSSANQRYFVPSSNSDLYRNRPVNGSLHEPQPYPNLFEKMELFTSEPSIDPAVGSLPFFNDTRAQLRGTGNFH